MKFDIERIENKGKGSGNRKVTDEQVIEAVNSGLFTSTSAIARYFKMTPQGMSQRIKRLKEKGLLD